MQLGPSNLAVESDQWISARKYGALSYSSADFYNFSIQFKKENKRCLNWLI